MRRLTLIFAFAAVAGPAAAHGGGRDVVGWTLDGWVTGPLALAALLFGVGARRLQRRGRAFRRRSVLLFASGWALLAGALVSPLHALGERAFSAHMLEHELLMLAAAPLLVLARPLPVMLWALPRAGRQAIAGLTRSAPIRSPWRALSGPVAATVVQAAVLWLWHLPSLFDRALASDGWHIAQHLSFLVSALIFWSAMFDRRRRIGLAAICLFATSVVSGALGALMAFSASPWYARYAELGLSPIGLTPTEDQQFAGLLMWIPGGLIHAGAALVLLTHLLHDREAAHAAV